MENLNEGDSEKEALLFASIKKDEDLEIFKLFATIYEGIIGMKKSINNDPVLMSHIVFSSLRVLEDCGVIKINEDIYKK